MPYKYPKAGEPIQLSLPPFKNKFACCGCGLVHRHEYEIKQTTRGPKGPTLWLRIFVDNRATATVRRNKKELHRTKKHYVAVFPRPKPKPKKRKTNEQSRAQRKVLPIKAGNRRPKETPRRRV